ncbi:ATP-binding protein [Roseateles violae]|uniref:histidine kinase n=1 Tax=Roseateles violae TaxID=3058042 RepID=A0ABT8DTF8_9BURK|nr:ATP-binding protein [Pelomonas sp. PFR6]MDN3921595.1 ATP-binding protein [Pelomonas sp. PFR6]
MKWLEGGRTPSLRRRLMLFLLGAIGLAALAQGLSSYRTALLEADEIFDYQMQQMALSLAGGLPGRAPPRELELIIQGWTAEGLQLFRSTVPLPQRAVMGFANVEAEDGKEYRVLSVQSGGQVLQVAQALSVRQRLAGRLALRTVMPIAIMLPILMLVVGWIVGRSLEPVERVRGQLARRAAQDLSPVAAAGLPIEVRPMVDEMNSLLARLQRSFEQQQHFVADAAHELRSPLTALKLQIQGLQRAPDEAARAQAQQRLAAGIERASHLVEQLLLLARQEAALEPRGPLALEPLLRRLVAEQAGAAQQRGIDLGLLRADPLSVPGQPEALALLLRNLLDNAIKYTPPGGRVDVSLLDAGAEARLIVEDSGPGIAEEERERVFDRFYRSETAHSATGSGLGLAIVKAIAERHGGRIRLDRSATLGGLRCELLLPKA